MAAEGGRVGVAVTQRSIDGLKYPHKIAIHVVIPESKDPKIFARQITVPAGVARSMHIEIVLSAIDFNDQPVP